MKLLNIGLKQNYEASQIAIQKIIKKDKSTSGEMEFYLNMENKPFHIISNKNNDNKYVLQLI